MSKNFSGLYDTQFSEMFKCAIARRPKFPAFPLVASVLMGVGRTGDQIFGRDQGSRRTQSSEAE
jgi:hypothetical protein